jgi:hypothetical protein
VDTAGPGSGTGHERTRSTEDVREYVQRLRSLPVDQVMGDVLFSLLNCESRGLRPLPTVPSADWAARILLAGRQIGISEAAPRSGAA